MIRNAKSVSARASRTSQKSIPVAKSRRTASVDTQYRGSYIPETRRSVSEERKSVFSRWSDGRKSSININDGKRVIKDSRPLHDRAYQKRKLADLVNFLEASEFNYPVSVAKLMSPSKKDFETIFQFLYNFWDPNYTVHRIEEEAPKILKHLRYPFTVNKSALMYVARTNWPVLLGVLIWMMDVNKFAMNLDLKPVLANGDSTSVHAILFCYVYQCYYSEHDSKEEDEEVFSQIIRSNFPGSLEELKRENEEKSILLKQVENELKEHDAMEKENLDLEAQIKSYQEYLAKMKMHMEMKKNVVKQLAEELNQKQSELNSLQDELKQKQDIYEAQGFDGKKHLNYLETQKKEWIEKLEKKNAELRHLQDVCWETDIQKTQIVEKRSQVCETFNELYAKAAEMGNDSYILAQKINHPMAKKLCEANSLHFPDIKLTPSEHSSGSQYQEHQKIFEQIGKNVKNLIKYIRGINSAQNEKLHEVRTLNSKLSVELKVLSTQVTETEYAIISLEKQNSEEMASLDAEFDKQLKVLESLQSKYEDVQKKCKELKDELQKVRSLKKKKEHEFEKYLERRDKLLLKAKEAVQEGNKFAEACREEILEKIQQLSKKC